MATFNSHTDENGITWHFVDMPHLKSKTKQAIMEAKESREHYTPTIEEFHEGFEYEYFDGGATMSGVNEWRSSVFDLRTAGCFDDGFMIEWYIDKQYCRVKSLDHDDIVSLGFDLESQFSDGANTKNYETIYVRNENVVRYRISLTSHGHLSISGWFHDNPKQPITKTLFRGYVKNKSELVRLLAQTGIAL